MKFLGMLFTLLGLVAVVGSQVYDPKAGSIGSALGGSMLFVGGTFLLIGIVFIAVARKLPGANRALRKTGVHGVGTVTGIRPTNMSDGQQARYVDLDMDIQLDTGGTAFAGSGHILVPVWEMQGLQGQPFTVYVRPQRPQLGVHRE